jgi:hypothetical protein
MLKTLPNDMTQLKKLIVSNNILEKLDDNLIKQLSYLDISNNDGYIWVNYNESDYLITKQTIYYKKHLILSEKNKNNIKYTLVYEYIQEMKQKESFKVYNFTKTPHNQIHNNYIIK